MKSNIKRILLVSFILVAFSCSMAFAAEVGSAEEFTAAWENASNGETITLTEDIVIDTNYTLEEKEITINLNGHIIDRGLDRNHDDDGNLFSLEDGATLNIIDNNRSTTHASGYPNGGVLCGGAGDDICGCIYMEDDTTLNMHGGSIYNCVTNEHGGAIHADGDGIVINLSDVTFYANAANDSADSCYGGAIYTEDDCQLNCTNCKFDSNSTEDDGGAVYLDDDTNATFKSCSFVYNKAGDEGGAIYQGSDSIANFQSCSFDGNGSGTDEGEGGALYIDSNEETTINNCNFAHNTSGGDGSAIYVNGDSTHLIDTAICRNTAGGEGAVYIDSNNSMDISGKITIYYNKNSNNKNSNLYLASRDCQFFWLLAELHNKGLSEHSLIGLTWEDFIEFENYQTWYFEADKSWLSIPWSDDEPENTASVFSDSTGLIIIGSVVIIAAAAAIVIIKKKKSA